MAAEGDRGDGSFSHKVADTVEAARFMAGAGRPVEILVGHSSGGAAVIAAARSIPETRAVTTVGAPYDPSHVEHQYDAVVERVLAEGEAEVRFGDKALTMKRAFVAPRRPRRRHPEPRPAAAGAALPHRPDRRHPQRDIFTAARHPRSLVSLEGSDHLLTDRGQARRAARIIGAWADPYLAEDEDDDD